MQEVLHATAITIETAPDTTNKGTGPTRIIIPSVLRLSPP